jgi:hypothetical protein
MAVPSPFGLVNFPTNTMVGQRDQTSSSSSSLGASNKTLPNRYMQLELPAIIERNNNRKHVKASMLSAMPTTSEIVLKWPARWII